MDLLERYLAAVAAQLPKATREDIIAELKDTLLSQFEDREAALGRPLTDDEREEILRAMGHPLVVAARYGKGPQSLIGPELFPYWLFAIKAGLLILLAVHGISLIVRVMSGSAEAGQAIAQAFHGVFGSGLTLIGVATVVGAVIEHYGVKPEYLDTWRVKDLQVLKLGDPGNWAAAMAGEGGLRSPQKAHARPWADALGSAIFTTVFVLWWIGLLRFPGLVTVGLRGDDAAIAPAPIWAVLYAPILIYALAQIGVNVFTLVKPGAVRMRAAGQAAVAAIGLVLTALIFQAGSWFFLALDGTRATIGGGWSALSAETLSRIGDGDGSLATLALNLGVILSWSLVVAMIIHASQVVLNLWRLARPARAL